MLETDEVDDDYFTPASGTSLASIFGKSIKEADKQNTTLKYVPSKRQTTETRPDDLKVTQCIFACALNGYEWFKDVYTARGKLGFAILQNLKTSNHNIILYDAKKTTLSNTLISSKFTIMVKGSAYISYYDDLQKYWSLYATEEEIVKVLEKLSSFNVIIKYSSYDDTAPPKPSNKDNEKPDKSDKESDTDASANRRTKLSILNRMANMGHSVLPAQTILKGESSDSSDSILNDYSKLARHKSIKNTFKHVNPERPTVEKQSVIIDQVVLQKSEEPENMDYQNIKGQLVPINNSSINYDLSMQHGNNMSLFMTEQRISNSEMRINMSRISDKVDQMLDKVRDIGLQNKDISVPNFQTEVLQKLLHEYEDKIKMYEQLLKNKHINTQDSEICDNNSIEANDKLNFEFIIKEKDQEICNLNHKLEVLNDSYNKSVEENKTKEKDLTGEIIDLKLKLTKKSEELNDIILKKETASINIDTENSENLGHKIKEIMNDTFQTILLNFENDESYSGENIKTIIGTVIRKVTLESLNK